MSDVEQKFEEQLAVLKRRYAERLEEKLKEFERLSASIANGSADDRLVLTQLIQCAHKLAGNAATFGYPALGSAAAELETVCQGMLEAQERLAPRQQAQIAERVASFRTLVSG